MSIYTPEIPTAFGALDSAVYEDGGPVDAHVLRTLATSAARLVCTGEPLINLVWDASSDLGGDEAEGALAGYGWPFWFRITPGPMSRPKMPGLRNGHVIVRAKLRSSETCLVQVETRRRPFSRARGAGDDNVITLTGTGSFAYTTISGLPIDPSDTERVAFWLKGEPTSTPGVTATYGSPNNGTIDRVSQPNVIEDDSATWNASPTSWAEGGHCVVIEDGSGNRLTAPRLIRGVGLLPGPRLYVYPDLEPGFIDGALVGATYKIYEIPQWRVAQLAIYSQDRTG